MRMQEHAFRAYYASMKDSDLLALAKNRDSFLPIAQALVAEELHKRHLTAPQDAPVETNPSMQPKETEDAKPVRNEQANAPQASDAKPAGSTNTPAAARPLTAAASIGATEDQVSMVGIVPERVDRRGTKIEDLAGTGEHDSLGG